MANRIRTDDERAWLYENVPKTEAGEGRAAFMDRFGWAPTATAWSTWNQKHGVRHKGHVSTAAAHCKVERRVRWSEEPEMEAWMLENDRGRNTKAVSDDFRARFGFGLTQTQISAFRSRHGTQTRSGRGNGRGVPVGTVSKSKNDYLKVKVRECPDVPGSKDNWEFVHVIEYRKHHGEVPPGHDIMFANHDIYDYSPDNLVAVPHRLQAQLKQFEYHDRESLEVAVALCLVQSRVAKAIKRPRPCAVCGKVFEQPRGRGTAQVNQCCQDCIAKGLHHRLTKPANKGEAVCSVCGSKFNKQQRNQVRCRKCIDEKPRYSASMQRRYGR